MEQTSKLQENTQIIDSPSLPQIPVTYLWFGKSVPEDYLISLADLDFPVVFLKNPKLDRNFTRQLMEVQKSDYYRLQHLYNEGGIYSDFDNIIDYPCLMKMLQPHRSQDKLVFQSVGKHTREKMKEMTNGMIFAPQKNMPILKKMLEGVDETKRKIWDFAGLSYLGKFTEPIEYDMSKCVLHTGDWSWFKDSNEVLKKNTDPHERFAKKLIKKQDFLIQQQELKADLKEIKQDNKIMATGIIEIIESNEKLIQQLKQFNAISQKQSQEKASSQIGSQNIKVLNNTKTLKRQFIEAQQNTEQNEIKSMVWAKEKQTLESYFTSLVHRNSQLKHERDLVMTSICGLSIFLVIFVVVGYLMIKKKKKLNS